MPKLIVRIAVVVAVGVWAGILSASSAMAGIDFRAAAPLPAPARPLYTVAGDLNRDGLTDLVVVSPASKTMSVYLAASSAAQFAPAVSYQLQSDNVQAPALGDVNGDGVLDVAVPVTDEGKIRIFTGNGDGSLKKSAVDPSGFASPTAVAIGTFGGRTGLLVTERRGAVVLAQTFPNFSERTQTCTGTGTLCPTGPRPDSVWALDLNHDATDKDAKLDFVTLDVGGGRVKSLTVALQKRTLNNIVEFATPQYYLFGDNPSSPITADVDHDGNIDFLAITQDVSAPISKVTIVRSKADGTLLPPTSFNLNCPYFVGNASCRALALAAGDFNGDGDVDLAVALNDPRSDSSAQARDQLLILVGRGTGEFSFGPVQPIGKGVLGLAAGNVGGDALADVVVASTRVMSVQAFINQSTTGDLGNGEQCTFGDECASSRCIDGVCCATACAQGEQCNVPGREGVCQPIPVQPMTCVAANQCASQFCVNGYCCDSACVGGRCDVAGYEGLCIPGRENGESCDDDSQCSSAICAVNHICCNERCEGGFCDDRGVCKQLLDLGQQCNIDQECASSVCDVFNGICCAARCDAITEDCNPEGQCVPLAVTMTPNVQTATPTATRTPRSTPAPDGELCSVSGDCQSEHCVDQVCCAVGECPQGQYCAEGTGQCVVGDKPTGTPTPTRIPTESPGNPCQPNPCGKGQKCVVATDGTALCIAASSSSGCSTTGTGGSGNLLAVALMPALLWAGRRFQLKRATVRARRARR